MFDNNVHYIMKELDSIYNVVVENLGKELLSREIKHLEYEPKMDRININNFIFIRLVVQNEDDHKEIYYDIYVVDENGNDTEHSMINVQRPFARLADKIDYLIKLDYWFKFCFLILFLIWFIILFIKSLFINLQKAFYKEYFKKCLLIYIKYKIR